MNRQVYILLLLLFIFTPRSACSDDVDLKVYSGLPGLEQSQALTHEVNNEKFDSLLQQGWDLLSVNPDKVRSMAEKASGYYDPKDTGRRIRLLNLTGITYFIQSAYENALVNYKEGLVLAINTGDVSSIGSFYNNIGIINSHIGHYIDALDHYLKAVNYFEEAGEEHQKLNTLNNMGLLFTSIENFEKAGLHLDQACKGFKAFGDSIGIAAVNNSRGLMFLKMQKPDSALYYLDKSIEIALHTQNRFGLSGSYIEKANVFFMMEDHYRAMEYFQKSMEVSHEINRLEKLCEAKIGMAKSSLAMDRLSEAIRYADQAKEIAGKLSNKRLQKEIHWFYSDAYERNGRYKESLQHNRIFLRLKDELADQSTLHEIYNLEIHELSQAKEIQQLEIERQELMISRKNSTIFFIVLAFILVMAGLYLLYHNHRYRQLAAHQQTILDLTEKKSRAAVEAEIQERKRIGQELHDGLGQMLSVARMNISVLQQKTFLTDERKNELMDVAIHSVDKAFYELRNISHNLAPSVLTEKGFTKALTELTDQINKSGPMKIHLELFGLNTPMDSLLENTLYRAIQELINNSLKHARAKDFYLQLVKNDTDITLVVEDNGLGFDMQKVLEIPGGGLNNLRSRVENLNGNVFIDTLAGRGTIVTIVIPLKKPKHVKKSYLSAGGRLSPK